MLVRAKRHAFVYGVLFVVMSWQFGEALYIYAKAILAQHLLQSAWEQTLNGERNVKPWPWADTWPVARLQVPDDDIDLIILAGDSGRSLAFGPGYRFGTARPGTLGTSMISAHRDTHFRFLQDLDRGSRLQLQREDGVTLEFTVRQMQVVDVRQTLYVKDTDESRLWLVTCFPFDAVSPGGPLRYVVEAVRQTENPLISTNHRISAAGLSS